MVKRMCVVAALALLAVPAVAQDYAAFVAEAKASLTKNFKDPQSAQYRGLYIAAKGPLKLLCGEVNAKNSYGAYVGFRRFFAIEQGGMAGVREAGEDVWFDSMFGLCAGKIRDL